MGSLAMSHSAALTPMPGHDLTKRALSLPHSLPQPVLMMTASPGCSVMFCFFSAPSRSDRDLVSVAEHLDALVAGDVDQHAARDQRADVVNPQLRKPRTGCVLGDLEAVVPAVFVGLVGKTVELSADLPDLGNDDLLVAAAPIGELVHEGAFDVHVEAPCAEERHIRIEHVSSTDDFPDL